MASPTIAFVGWNPFQVLHSLPVARHIPGSCIVIEKRKRHLHHFDDKLLTDPSIPIVVWPRGKLVELDGTFDAIVCQTKFRGIEQISRSRILMLQYGYAKEVHNYGDWRAHADLCLVYGEYAANKIKPHCPVALTGNPALDAWHDPGFQERCRAKYAPLLDRKKKTVLYLPTWGDLSTHEVFIRKVMDLADEYNVLLKLHHNTALMDKRRARSATSQHVATFGPNDSMLDLLAVSDLVLSDYSGAIFDALYCAKPVVLLQGDIAAKVGDKLNTESLEHARRDDIGPVVKTPDKLRQAVGDVFSGRIDFTAANRSLVSELYLPGPGAAERAADTMVRFLDEGGPRG